MIAFSPKILLCWVSSIMTLYYRVKWNAWRGECLGPGLPPKEDRVFLPEQGKRQICSGWEKGWTRWRKRQCLTYLPLSSPSDSSAEGVSSLAWWHSGKQKRTQVESVTWVRSPFHSGGGIWAMAERMCSEGKEVTSPFACPCSCIWAVAGLSNNLELGWRHCQRASALGGASCSVRVSGLSSGRLVLCVMPVRPWAVLACSGAHRTWQLPLPLERMEWFVPVFLCDGSAGWAGVPPTQRL